MGCKVKGEVEYKFEDKDIANDNINQGTCLAGHAQSSFADDNVNDNVNVNFNDNFNVNGNGNVNQGTCFAGFNLNVNVNFNVNENVNVNFIDNFNVNVNVNDKVNQGLASQMSMLMIIG